jgi:hypothetical protein
LSFLVEGIIGADGKDREPDQSFAEKKQEGDYTGTLCPFAGGTVLVAGIFLHFPKIAFCPNIFKSFSKSSKYFSVSFARPPQTPRRSTIFRNLR